MKRPYLTVHELPSSEVLAGSASEFLGWLGGASWLRIAGRDRSRTRALATLLHGNEPSGLRALQSWLRSARRPAVDVVCFVAAVEAARLAPGFAHRFLPDGRDLNRCFLPPFEEAEGRVAEQALDRLRRARPEALIDLHNTTGHTPPYGVVSVVDRLGLALTSLFGDYCVHTDLRLGALTEVASKDFPAVTIECGRAGSPEADAVAATGLERYLGVDRLEELPAPSNLEILRAPVRVQVRPGVRVAYGDRPVVGAELTLSADIDRHNFDRLHAGMTLGWIASGTPWPLVAQGADGEDVSRSWFGLVDGRLVARRDGFPIMMTTDPSIAVADCLFYLTEADSR